MIQDNLDNARLPARKICLSFNISRQKVGIKRLFENRLCKIQSINMKCASYALKNIFAYKT